MATICLSVASRVIKLLFLFTKSDIKTTLIPVSFFAAASVPLKDVSRLLEAAFWIWLHLLQFDVSNQIVGLEEDVWNKPDRPLPAKLITLKSAILFRWLLVLPCFALSYWYSTSVLSASIALVALTVIYNELGAHSHHWLTRNAVNAAGFASFEWGSTLVAGADSDSLTDISLLAICISFGIFATTIQTQDFKDVEGDKRNKRRTLPILYPIASRYSVVICILAWTLMLCRVWNLGLHFGLIFLSLGLVVTFRFLTLHTRADDQVSFYWYNVWLSTAHFLPFIWRLRSGSVEVLSR
ncbi:hypothetical protein BDZ89DRAFT_1200267 [Hymenopellis radicata]|nr:hypothetical protein BDZ89DRAFT_1200267 [Hymenopellis radicata]